MSSENIIRYKIHFSRSNVDAVFDASVHETLLDVAIAAGIPIAYDCCAGVDGICQIRCEGSTQNLQEPCIDVSEGKVLVCIASPTSDVVLDA